MKIELIGKPNIIMSNPDSKHNFFGWPTVAKLQNGKIAVTASGFRLKHICPFGKTVISYSEDEGKTYTKPAPVIDTVLDDRDGGIVPFGESGVIVTSFNNLVELQRGCKEFITPYGLAYLDTITKEEEQRDIGSNFRISNDFGVTFGNIHKSPISSPHGPIVLKNGTVFWVGRVFRTEVDIRNGVEDGIKAYTVDEDGKMTFCGEIEKIEIEGFNPKSCEPHAIELDDGTILVHINVYDKNMFTIFQSESKDMGKTWTKPRQILEQNGGAPPHLFKHSSGMLISAYCYRQEPYCIRVMFSKDNGATWDKDYDLYINGKSWDMGYPSTIELSDGSLLTVFYASIDVDGPTVIMQQRWKFHE